MPNYKVRDYVFIYIKKRIGNSNSKMSKIDIHDFWSFNKVSKISFARHDRYYLLFIKKNGSSIKYYKNYFWVAIS